MSPANSASDREAAVRCVDCPSCGAQKGAKCHHISKMLKVPAHKRRVDKFYNDTFGPESPAVKEMLEEWARGGSGSE